MDQDTLDRIENQRLELENNIAKLRKSLRHWQTLEIDYEGLKEEFQGLPEDASRDECLKVARDFNPDLVNEKELQSLLGSDSRNSKRPSQLADVLSKRVEYVLRNVATIRNQLSDAEKKRNALLLAKDPDHQDDAALPLGEIIEELDDDGRVISSKVQTTGKDTNDLIDVLRKAGVPDLKPGEDSFEPKQVIPDSNIETTTSEVVPSTTTGIALNSTASETKLEEQSSEEETDDLEEAKLGPVNPGDSEEDAALRQEMLRYGLGEVGAIVAELDLKDSGNLSDDEDADYLSDYDEDEDLYTDESEDEKGATINPVISERYKRQMEALSQKHGITDLKNLGPEPELPKDIEQQINRPSAAEAARKAAIAREEANRSALKVSDKEDESNNEPQKKKKKVAFSPDIEFSKDTPPTSISSTGAPPPLQDIVVERPTTDYTSSISSMPSRPPQLPVSTTTKKPSRFKAARTSTPQTPLYPPPMSLPTSSTSSSTDPPTTNPLPTGPPNRTISTTLVERPFSETALPTDPSDFNEELHRREVAVEYQKMRNRRIHAQGGYVAGGEDENYGEEIVPDEEIDEETGKPKKVSRFKAARSRNQ